MFKHLLIGALLCLSMVFILVNSQTIKMTVAIFDHHPLIDNNFEPADGSITKGLLINSLDPISKVPQLKSLDVNDPTNYAGRIVNPSMFKYFFSPDPTNKFLTVELPLTKTSTGYYEYSNDYFFPIDGTASARLGWDALGYRFFYDGRTYHNYHFCLKMNTYFKYSKTNPPMQFNFRGDDDVYVFINNKLALDLGGLHTYEDGSIIFNDATAANLGLIAEQIYSFDFYYCERHTTGSHMKFQINFPLDCSQKDFCGVCNGNGDCCQAARDCTKYAPNDKCMNITCPAWNANVDLNNIGASCNYPAKDYSYLNSLCTHYKCDPTTGSSTVDTSYVPCPAKPCTTSKCATTCQYSSTCEPINACQEVSCGADGVTCVRKDKNCQGTDVCKTYSCNNDSGCTVAPKCPSQVTENGVVNPCKYYTCSVTGDCIINNVTNCNSCSGTPNKCQVYDTCSSANGGVWTFKNRTDINDNNLCTADDCNLSTGVVTHTPITCPGCTSCDPTVGYQCLNPSTSCDDQNACTNDFCGMSGNCTHTDLVCPVSESKCEIYSCDIKNGCVIQPRVCPDSGNCQVGSCDLELGCVLKPRVCLTERFCLEGYCDERLGCLSLNRTCSVGRPNCQYGLCNDLTAECETHDYDPYPFICKTGAVISVGVAAGIAVAGAVAVGLAVFGGKKGYDYWKETKGNRITMANNNPMYEQKPGGGENPLYAANAN